MKFLAIEQEASAVWSAIQNEDARDMIYGPPIQSTAKVYRPTFIWVLE